MKKQPKKKKKKKHIVISSIALILLFAACVSASYIYFQLLKVNTTKISKDNTELGISKDTQDEIAQLSNPPINIALFGVDSRTKEATGNSDSIIVASIDKKHNKIKLSSLMRDSRVQIDGHGKLKLNSAYMFGGPQFAIKTINENFGLDIKDFITVNFFNLEKIIDELGGVSIDVQPNEVKYINEYMKETSAIEKKKLIPVTKSGVQTLNGMQAVSYSRIRYIGNDQQRTERQRTVLTGLFNKIQSGGVLSFASNVSKLLPYVETSMSSTDILSLGKDVLTSGTSTIAQARFPLDSYSSSQTINSVSYIVLDLPNTKDQLHKFIYDDIVPKEKK